MAQNIHKLFQWSEKGNTECEEAENEVPPMHLQEQC